MIPWITNRRRRQLLETPFPTAWLRHLQRNVRHNEFLSDDEQSKLRDDLRIFIDEKYWEGVGGQELTEEMQVTIAAEACLLTLNMEEKDYYKRVRTILVYPNAFVVPPRPLGRDGIISEGGINAGEAWFRGPIVLSWSEALAGARGVTSGRNLVLHEFAHALDMNDGLINGTPLLNDREQYKQWHRVMTEEFERLQLQSERGEATLMDQYGALNVAEFFAVATECFFERGAWMRRFHPPLYDVLQGYYKQDPAARAPRA